MIDTIDERINAVDRINAVLATLERPDAIAVIQCVAHIHEVTPEGEYR